MDNINNNERITLWTSQRKIVLDILEKEKIYHAKKGFIMKKYEEVANIFLESYNWFVYKAEKIVPKPEGAQYPIWLFSDLKYLDHHEDSYILELSVERKEVILFDHTKWNKILNLSYLPEDDKDGKKYEELLNKQGIYDETVIYMTNYYPHLKMQIRKSWDRLFENNTNLFVPSQAALWEIRKEWVVKVL